MSPLLHIALITISDIKYKLLAHICLKMHYLWCTNSTHENIFNTIYVKTSLTESQNKKK